MIARLRAEGRPVRVAVVTNGDAQPVRSRLPLRHCGAPRGWRARTARFGTCRNRETVEAMELLGLRWTPDARRSDVLFLGYPNNALETIAASPEPWRGDASGLHRTYALDAGRRCEGDLRFLLDGRHSQLSAPELARDVETLLELVRPADVYTHAGFDGHPDHAETSRQVWAALERLRLPAVVHATLIHPEGTRARMAESAREWPNPAEDVVAGPLARFTPDLAFEPPPVEDDRAEAVRAWGPQGPPDELVDVPSAMRAPDPERNLKWQVISRHRSQIVCAPDRTGKIHASCGYLRAFVKRHEFFWVRRSA